MYVNICNIYWALWIKSNVRCLSSYWFLQHIPSYKAVHINMYTRITQFSMQTLPLLSEPEVSNETGALLVYSCFITYKSCSHRPTSIKHAELLGMWRRVNPECMFSSLKISEGNYLKTVKDTQNLIQRYRKPSRRGFQIISYMFNLNVKQALANQICWTHNMCIITQNNRKCQNTSKCLLRNGTESNDTSSYILLDHSNAFCLSGWNFLWRTS